jgi:hypothetical protein
MTTAPVVKVDNNRRMSRIADQQPGRSDQSQRESEKDHERGVALRMRLTCAQRLVQLLYIGIKCWNLVNYHIPDDIIIDAEITMN